MVELYFFKKNLIKLAENKIKQILSADHLSKNNKKTLNGYNFEYSLTNLMNDNFIEISVLNRNGILVEKSINPNYSDFEKIIHKEIFAFDGKIHATKSSINDRIIIQTIIPVSYENSIFDGYIFSIFLADKSLIDKYNNNIIRNIVIILIVIIFTVIMLYPVILSLNKDVAKFASELIKSNIEIAQFLGSIVSLRDSKTSLHNYRVSIYAIYLGESVNLDSFNMRNLILGAFLHDIGKIGIGDSILLKPGPLTDDEKSIMRTHVNLGVNLIQASSWLSSGKDVVAHHHEWYDGSGYPDGISKLEIPLIARIFSIADVFDALSTDRPYKKALPYTECINKIQFNAGSHFDPILVERFTEISYEIYTLLLEINENEMAKMLENKSLKYFNCQFFKNICI